MLTRSIKLQSRDFPEVSTLNMVLSLGVGPSDRSPTAIVGSNPIVDMDVCLLCVLLGRGFCDGLITRLEDSYRLWRVVVCDKKNLVKRGEYPALGCRARENNN
jgi:hypothetical protein